METRKVADLQPHPYADLFPMMTAAELDALTADVAQHGLRNPVVLYRGAVLDGRNRLAACAKAGIEPSFTEHDGDDASALALVISLNVQRRDLTAAQRAIVAARALPAFEMAAKDRMAAGGQNKGKVAPTLPSRQSRDDAARVFKVGSQSISQAKALLANAPDLVAQVEACTLSLAAAYEQHQKREYHRIQKEKDAARVAEYRDAISNGEMKLEDALQKAIEEERKGEAVIASQADARSGWLKELAALLDWTERYIGGFDDDYLTWYTEPDSPGQFDHGITADRVSAMILQLARARDITFKGTATEPSGEKKPAAGKPARPRDKQKGKEK